ncbi:hypothetical protein BDW02DRAFT_577973 [Decorospora gaudefroyi]|uniref:Uncharacterized protein n=1 Tax=Decorospora gaudefroyi TaxID=184978 RepID=A0A6A5KL48_9PLEO|nr:hypothetical protein BDW02DRAFT_577973 [Decorospora gaudefroyi]
MQKEYDLVEPSARAARKELNIIAALAQGLGLIRHGPRHYGTQNRDNQVIATISSNDELLALANSQPEFVRSMLAELMNNLRNRLEKLIAKQRHYEKEVTILQNTLSVTELERDDSKREINRLSHLSAFKTGCSDPDHAELYEDWKHEESQATKFYNLYLEFFEKHKAERAKTDCYYEQQAERDADNADLVAQNKALKQRLVLAGEATDKLQGQLTRQHQEYNDVVSRLQRYDHNFRPFTIQRREGRVRDREDIETTRPRRPLSPERRETRLTSSPNPYPSRQITPLQPLPRTNHFSRNGRRHSRNEFESYLDILEGLDPYYARSTYEKVSDAQSKLSDGSLKTAPNEKFADWRGRFMSVCRLVKLSDQAMIGYARTFLRPSLAVAASHAFEDEQDNALVKFLDAARRADMTQKQINQGKSIGTEKSRSTTTKPRQRSPNDRNAERKARTSRGQQQEAVAARKDWQRKQWPRPRSVFAAASPGTKHAIRQAVRSLTGTRLNPSFMEWVCAQMLWKPTSPGQARTMIINPPTARPPRRSWMTWVNRCRIFRRS